MHHELLPKDSLLWTQDDQGNAVAAIILKHVVFPLHVYFGYPSIHAPRNGEVVEIKPFPVQSINQRDIVYTLDSTEAEGFTKTAPAELNQELTIVGYHGANHTPFEIEVIVTQILQNGRVIVDWLDGAAAQVGMSGSVAVTTNNEAVGILVEGVAGTNGKRLYLETVHDLPLRQPSAA
jgi:hypothetical protein